jgi:nitroreductase
MSDDMLRVMRRMRAIKEYTPQPIDEQTIQHILEVGRWTGTGGNRQPTEVVVVRDVDTRTKFGAWGARPAAGAPLVLLLVTTNDQSAFDEGRMAERLCLAAAASGLGSTVATLKEEGPDRAKQLLDIPQDRRARTIVAIGHPDAQPRPAGGPGPSGGRKPLSEFAHWDRYLTPDVL